MPAISVIIPVYNVENYLERCLNSIINQTYKDIEIICINDGSTDRSGDILEEFAKKDPRIKIINQSNKGVSNARNIGISIAQGEYLSFIDSDDYIETTTFEFILNQNLSDIDLICFGTEIVGDIDTERKRISEKYYKIKYKGKHRTSPKILNNLNVSASNKIFKTEIVKKYNIKFPQNLNYEDFGFYWMYYPYCAKILFVQEKFYKYVRRNGSILNKTFKGTADYVFDHLYIFEVIYNFYKQNNLIIKDKGQIENIFLKCFDFVLHFTKPENYNKVIQIAQNIIASTGFEYKNARIKAIKNNNIAKATSTLSLLQKIFYIKNKNQYKVINILGIKIKLKRQYNSSKTLSVIIPTMQKNKELLVKLISLLASSNIVGEIIIINNANEIFTYDCDKIKIINSKTNLFVNASWNIGINNAQFDNIALLNDDIILPQNFIELISNYITPQKGIIGIDENNVINTQEDIGNIYADTIKIKPINYRNYNFGVAMFFNKYNYTAIPEELKIWNGDDWLFDTNQKSGRQNYVITEPKIYHYGSLTTKSENLNSICENDKILYEKIFDTKILTLMQKIFSIKEYKNYYIIRFLFKKIKTKKQIN